MPRDSKGNPYGIGSRVNTPHGPITVAGFSVQVQKHDMKALASAVYPHRIYRWTEIEVIDPSADPYRYYHEPTMEAIDGVAHQGDIKQEQLGGAQTLRVDYAGSVDTCMADVVQRTSGIAGGPGPFRRGFEAQIQADKTVWGS